MNVADVNVMVGPPMRTPLFTPITDTDSLNRQLATCGIEAAMVWHCAQKEGSPLDGNGKLLEYLDHQPHLYGCWALLPPQTGETPLGTLINAMRHHQVRAVRLFPKAHRFLIHPLVLGRTFGALAERGIPVLVSLNHDFTWESVYDLLAICPSLTCVLCDTGIWSQDRYLYPLLDAYPHLHVETSMPALTDGALETAVGRYGPTRFIFGSGFPERYIEAPLLQLIHADLSPDAKQAIARDNFLRLMREVEL